MLRRFSRSQSGAAIVEFALVAPVLIFLVIGLIEIGRFMFFGIVAAHAAEAGAQYGSQSLTNAYNSSGISSAANADSSNTTWHVVPTQVCYQGTTLVTCPSTTPDPQSTPDASITYYVNVKVTGTLTTLLNYPGIPNSVPVSASTTMRVLSQ